MAADVHEFIMRARAEGFEQAAQDVLRGTNRAAQAFRELQLVQAEIGRSNRGASVFDTLADDGNPLTKLSLESQRSRDYDVLLGKQTKFYEAELKYRQAMAKLDIPLGEKGYIGDSANPVMDKAIRDLYAAGPTSRMNDAAKAYADAQDAATKELREQVEQGRRRAILGPLADQPVVPRNDPQYSQLQAAVDRGRREAQAQRSIEQKRMETEDLAAREAAGKRSAIQQKRNEEEDLANREATGKRVAIERKRTEQEDLANREAIGQRVAIERKRQQAEDLANREAIGQRRAIERKRLEQEDLANREAIGRRVAIERRRIETEDLAAAEQRGKDAEGRRQAAIAGGFQQTYASPLLGTKLGDAEERVNKAERALYTATENRAALLARGNPTAVQLLRSEQAVTNANNALAASRRQVAAVQTRQSAGFGGQFMEGFRGASDRPYAEQLGQAFKFSVFYGTAYKLLFAFTTTLTATLQEGIAFQSAMTELKIASGLSADAADELATSLSQQAVAAGQAPSVGVAIGAKSLGLYGATQAAGASQAEMDRVSDITTRVVSRMALGSDLPVEELTTQLAAVANAFGTGAAGQIQAADLDAYLGRQFGVQQGLILQAVAESANVGQAAGFDQEQISAIAGALISRTGQSPSAVAGYMAQIFSRGGEGSLTSVTGRYGIDPNAELSTQIAELAAIYRNASNTEQSEILSSFGRGKVQNAVEVLIGGFPEIDKAANDARGKAGGTAEEVAELRLKDIGGQIQVTVAAMQDFASALGGTGVLELLGAGVVAFREFLEATTALLRAWNSLDGVVRGAIAALALFTIATRTSAGAAGLSMLGGLGTRSAASAGVNLASVMAPYGGVAGATNEPVRGAGGAGVRGALATAGPWIAAAAGLYAIGELTNTSKGLKAAQEAATEALNAAPLGAGATPDQIRARASELGLNATEAREGADISWMTSVIPVFRNDAAELRDEALTMEFEAERLSANAKLIEDAAADVASSTASVITGFDEQGLGESLDRMTRGGASAREQMDALTAAVLGAGGAASTSAAAFDPRLFAAQQTDALTGLLSENITGIDGKNLSVESVRNRLDGINSTPEAGVMQELSRAGIEDFEDFDIGNVRAAAEALVQKVEGTRTYIGTDEYENAVTVVSEYLLDQTRQARIMVDATVQLSPEDAMVGINNFIALADEVAGNTQETDFRGRSRLARQKLRGIQRFVNRTKGGETGEMSVQLDLARRAIADAEFEELETMRRAAQNNARSRAEVARIGQRFLRRELRSAIRNGSSDRLAEIIGQAGGAAVGIARAIIQEAVNAARAARATYLAILAVQREAQSVLGAEIEYVRGGVSKLPEGSVAAQNANKLLGTLKQTQSASGDKDVYTFGSDTNDYEPLPEPEKGKSKEDKKAEREAARQEMLDLKNNLYLLSIDLTDPLATAVAAVKDARRRLASDISSGQDRGTVVASRLALKQAENEREATAFQQQLDSIITAEELGRITHRKKISYLENEKRRLEAIKNRTFQQQSQLDQVDRLLQDAASAMQGAWNFGDIKLPTPFQVRRQVEQFRLDSAGPLNATSQQQFDKGSTIYIDGADVGKVRQIIHETLGRSNATVTNRPRRR